MQDQLANASIAVDFGSWSADPSRADYACPDYLKQSARWQTVKDVRGGTIPIRHRREVYLPKFDAESVADWNARVTQTFVNEVYADTVEEHVGLVFSEPVELGDDVPERLVDLCEDIDGEGNHFEVFAQTAFDDALHWGHTVLYTDYPDASNITDLAQKRAAGVRAYVTKYNAPDVLSWRTAVVGGKKVIIQIVFREQTQTDDDTFGVKTVERYREVKQDAIFNPITGAVESLGAIRWRLFEKDGEAPPKFTGQEGVITKVTRIPARVVYGGVRLGVLHTKPHLMGLAYSNIEETQVSSDYGMVMHKCNVPTPVFEGRQQAGDGSTLKLGEGIDIPIGGKAYFMEPTGVALNATRTRLEDIRARMVKHGASSSEATQGTKAMTATQARIYTKQRNAKLARAARSLQDALEGVLADMAAFEGVSVTAPAKVAGKIAPVKTGPNGRRVAVDVTPKSGGSVIVNQNFSGDDIDPPYLTVLVQAFVANALPLEALMFALKTGRLPEEFSAEEEALKLVAAEIARQKAAAANPTPDPQDDGLPKPGNVPGENKGAA